MVHANVGKGLRKTQILIPWIIVAAKSIGITSCTINYTGHLYATIKVVTYTLTVALISILSSYLRGLINKNITV